MTQDAEPGYPLDLRPPDRRRHLAEGPTGDFEAAAARIVARLTGERVVIQDDGSRQAMPDIRIDYEARPTAYVEVVVDIDTAYAAMEAETLKSASPLPSEMVWQVRLTGRSSMKQLRTELPGILGRLRTSPTPQVTAQLAGLGVRVDGGPWPPRAGQQGRIQLFPEGISGSVGLGWEPFLTWINAFLTACRTADVRSKLAATGAAERHAFIAASFTSPGDAYFALHRDGRPHLPPTAPNLPAEITHLWVASLPVADRCLAWFPDRGWLDVMDHWATC